jgi:tRNA(His) guanylyltransferase
MTDKTAIGDRMKRYEEAARIYMTPRMPLIIRVDGRAFHTYTKRVGGGEVAGTDPWNGVIRDAMTDTARALMADITGAKIAYIQSDEISVLVTDYDKLSSEPWFGKNSQKVCSVSASVATMAFNNNIRAYVDSGLPAEFFPTEATFDSRAYCVPREDVTNYFVWRQRDAEKNSISMLAQYHFSHKQLHGKSGSDKQDMLMREHGVNWNEIDTWKKRGWCVDRKVVTMTYAEFIEQGGVVRTRTPSVDIDPDTPVTRTNLDPDWEIPIFTKDRDYIERFVNVDQDEEET